MHHTNISSMGSDSTTSLFFRDLGARWLTSHDEAKGIRTVGQKKFRSSARTFVLPNLGRRSGVTDTHTDGQTDKSKSASPGQNLLNGNGVGPPLAGTTARDHQGSGVGCGWWTGDRTVRTLLLRHQTRTPVQRRGVRPLTQPTRRRQQPVVRRARAIITRAVNL